MTRRFELLDVKPGTFWEVTVTGATVAVVYGRVGTAGRRQEKVHSSPEAAYRAVKKQIAAKLRKGYREQDRETVGEGLSSGRAQLRVPFVGHATFELGYRYGCGISQQAIGRLTDDVVSELVQYGGDWPSCGDWEDYQDIFFSWGPVYPADYLLIPSKGVTGVPVDLDGHCPEESRVDLEALAFARSSRGDFLHITEEHCKARGWSDWYSYTLDLGGDHSECDTFDISRVEVHWCGGKVSGYSYRMEYGVRHFEEYGGCSLDSSGIDTVFYFNDGAVLRRVSLAELFAEPEESEIDVSSIDAVRARLLAGSL